MTAMSRTLATNDPLEFLDVVDRHAASRLVADLFVGGIEERRDLESFLTESGVVGKCETKITGAHDCDTQVSIEAENLPEMPAQILDVVADTANAELTEVRQVLANLCGVELIAFGQRLRRDRLHSGRIQFVEAPEVHRQAICREFRDLIGCLPALVQPIHKVQCYHHAPWHMAP